ncbi:putative mitochondrial calpain-like cysteine peptidase [Leptomonas pyrrhocoris]|uniref:Putative mitochondrial calpain-like cysteine peptidase n=1 Tax=Leptomonas pyrrhocoris TaxID=157538 RepID=A0A0M9FPQ6_LEPPY|nr:putative mitochondrial calpain-like cysteine peptidase [Leptomonas pyrrhocoris]KPA73487.1 putative mitochondrial calpain-like cysteine peptidase [Leptomonas pyrrhocoris]|eukprot:XP_015651926.1 putative mitochondrial calpain-like cysteine peptidase [Leptomonas pyrrhocoris]
MPSSFSEVPDSGHVFVDTEFTKNNGDIADQWKRIKDIYPSGVNQPLLPETFSREQFGQGNHYECFMLSALSTLIRFPDVIRSCFVSKKVREDGRYTFQFFRGKEWVKVEIDDKIAMEEGEVLYCRSPTEHWWPLLLEKAYAKFYTAYDHLEGCTLQETFHDLTGNPVLNIPMDPKLAKAASCNILEGRYWLDLAQRIQSGQFVASALTKDVEVENMGLQREQQYGILDVFSLSGTSAVDDIVVHMHNPLEDDEFIYTGPLNRNDVAWTAKQRAKYDVDNPRSIFLPLNTFLRIVNSMQLCYVSTFEADATYFEDEWKGESAGGNPTFVTWRKNPLYYISNHGTEAVTLSFVVKQKDQRHLKGPEEETTYMQCGMILSQYSYLYPIPTFWVTGNNHKPIHKSLFLNSREVANSVTIPPQSLCYLVPSCMHKGEEAPFLLAVYRMAHENYSQITMRKLDIPKMDWRNPAYGNVELQMRTKDRLDFYVDEETDVHILMHQTKPYISPKTGGDAMAQDYMGMYLYDDTDRKIAGVHAATNFRETSIIHHLPRSGRYALSLTCPRGKGSVPAVVTIVSSATSHVRRVETPADAGMLPDELEVVEEDSENTKAARIDYFPFTTPASDVHEVPDSSVPFEDRAFMLDNRDLTSEPWVHIGDLYPKGKTKPLLPDVLSRDQFEQGTVPECRTLIGFATLIAKHPDVIRNCFISKKPRKDGRYTFQFHRYGQWVKVEIDDRIPMIKGDTLFCRSPTHHWWPLLLEKAYAKFYKLYDNLEGCSLAEVYHDFSGCPVINVPLDPVTARSAGFDVASPAFWMQLRDELPNTAMSAQSSDEADRLGVNAQQFYGVLDIIPTTAQPQSLADVVVQLHNPYAANTYSGPMANRGDRRWAAPQLQGHQPSNSTIYVPADVFAANFFTLSQAHLSGLVEPCWNFNSEWGEGTNGGNPSLLTWRQNPLYVVRNASEAPVEIVGMIRQPDKRHQFHLLAELNYVRCDLLLAQSMENSSIPTYLVTHNNHRIAHKGVFLNYREVANFIAIPAHSLCYLVPTAMYHEKSIFMLSYWYKKPADARAVSIARLKTDVAHGLPAVKHVTMQPQGKDRVDFLVDVPTDAHILLSQWNQDSKGGNDVRTENFVGMYLYDDANQQVARVSSASNLKEIGLVTHLPAAGHYVLSLTCPVAKDDEVKCRVEIVGVEAARVRITDASENAPSFDDFAEEPPVQPVNMDDVMNPDRHIRAVEPVVAAKPAVNTVQQPAKAPRAAPALREAEAPSTKTPSLSFLNSFYEGVPKEDIPLKENPALMHKAQEREALKRHPSENASRILGLENSMHDLAAKMADDMHKRERAFLDPQPEGVPLELLPLNEDVPFTKLEHDLRTAMKDPRKNHNEIVKLQDKLNDRAREMARELKDDERERFLNPMPLGIPVGDLPLDEDPRFHALEVERLRERAKDAPDAAKTRKLEDAMNARAEELARQKLAENRDYLKPEHLHVANDELPLDANRGFVLKEAARQEQMKSPRPNARVIAALEDELNDMAEKMAAELLAKQRPGYLARDHNGRLIDDLPLNNNDGFLQLERDRRDLLKVPKPDMAKIADIEDKLNVQADEMAKQMNRDERPRYLKPSYYGKPTEELPLDDDAQIAEWEAQRARLRHDPGKNAAAIRAVEDKINARAAELAKEIVNRDRKARYGSPRGIPVELLDLDGDPTMRRLEAEHMDLLSMPKPDPRAIAANEVKLNARVEQLAKDFLENLRADITGDRAGSPSLMSDAPYRDMEDKLIALMSEDPQGKKDQIDDLKEALSKRNAELKRQRAQALRSFLDPKPFGIPIEELNVDGDTPFLQKEAELKKVMAAHASPAAIEALQDEMQERVNVLAAHELARRYPYLDTNPASMPLETLPAVGKDEPFWEAIRAAERAKSRGAPQQHALETAVNDRLRQIAEDKKWKEREDYLQQHPDGVYVRQVPLDINDEFRLKERERRRLLSEDSSHTKRLHELEDQLNAIAFQLATEKKWADREALLGKDVSGVPLHDVPLDEDAAYVAMEDQWRDLKLDPKRNAAAIADVERKMKERARQLADDKKWADREALLGESVEDMPLRAIGLDDDPAYVAMEDEQRKLKADPERNAHRLADLEERMKERAHELAKKAKEEERDEFLPRVVGGVERDALELDDDKPFRDMEERRRKLLADDPKRNAAAVAQVEDALRARAEELAAAKKNADRGRILDPKPENVELRHVNLDDDPDFTAMESEWRKLMRDPRANARRIAELEKNMNDSAHRLADARKWADRNRILDPKPEGVKLAHVPLDDDAEFLATEDEWRELMRDPRANARRIAELEKNMNDSAHRLADARKWADRNRILDPKPEGVKLAHVPLDDDAEFLATEDEWRELMRDPRANARRIAELEKNMNARAHEIADDVKWAEREDLLGKDVNGVPLHDVPLDEDAAYVAMEDQWRDLKLDPKRNAAAIADVERKMKERARQLADDKKWADREALLGESVEDMPLRAIGLDDDPAYVAMEDEQRKLKADPERNAHRLADLEERMKERAHELAKKAKEEERDEFLPRVVGGVERDALELDDDKPFRDMEERRRKLLADDPKRNAAAVAQVEDALRARAEELAAAKKNADRGRILDPKPENVELRHVNLDDDPDFTAMESEWRKLMRDPRANARRIAELEKNMNDSAHRLADARKWADRNRILDPKPEGVKLAHVPLDDDAEFLATEDEWRELMRDPRANARRIAELEKNMNDSAHRLADARKWADRNRILDPKPEGVKLAHVPLDDDAEFLATEDEWRELMRDPRANARRIAELEKNMNARAHEIADDVKWAEREDLLGKDVNGVPLHDVPLDEDAAYVAMEDQWRDLKLDPKRNAAAIADVERKMKERARQLADDKKWADREALLGESVEDMPLRAIGLDDDPAYVAMEDEQRKLKADPERNAHRLADLEERMKERAHELAKKAKEEERDEFLPRVVGGVERDALELDDDKPFRDMEERRRKLLADDPKRNAAAVAQVEDALRARAEELAAAKKNADRGRILDPKPENVELRHVNLDDDPDFTAMESEWRKLMRDPRANARRIAELEKNMNDSAHRLADARKWADRNRILDPKPEGVKLAHVPLDDDAEFLATEDEWRELMRDPRANARRIAELEKNMNDSAHRLADARKWADRNRILDPKPEGVKLAHVPLDDDAEFLATEDEWRELMRDPRANARRIAELEKNMNARAHEIADDVKWAEREDLLGKDVNGVPLHDVPLDEDAAYVAMEDQWRDLKLDPKRNARRIADVEKKMDDRVHALAREELKKTAKLPFNEADGVAVSLLPLEDDAAFRRLADEYARKKLNPQVNPQEVQQLEKEMRDRAEALARRRKDADRRRICGAEMDEMLEHGAELDRDEMFQALEHERYHLEAADAKGNKDRIQFLEEAMRQRARELAKPRVHSEYRGVPVEKLNEFSGGELFHKHPGGNRRGSNPEGELEPIDPELDAEARRLAEQMIEQESYPFLGDKVHGVPINKIPFRKDQAFMDLADERRRAMYFPEDYPPGYKAEVEEAMRRRVGELADQYKRDHPKRVPAVDKESPMKPSEAPQGGSSGSRRPRDKKVVREVEERTEEHRLETVEEAAPFVDPSFHSANEQVANLWPRIADIYPEGLHEPLIPDHPRTSDVASPAGDLTYLAPFLAALSRQPPLLHRLFQTKTHPVRAPYSFIFFDPNSIPVAVEIDDRVPCDEKGVPRFTVSPTGAWWPLLLEKAYAKYVGGYERFDDCTSHETLRDLTGRPVTHLPFDTKLASEVANCNYRDVAFWRRTHNQLEKGDVFMAVSNEVVPDGIHPHCYYAVFDVIETVPGSNDPSDIVVKIHNCYHDAPEYMGPLCAGDQDWTPTLRSVCKADPENEPEFLYLPQPIFLRNFSSMQRCHINCGDRLTVSGEWNESCSGGNPKYTTFRSNPIYLVQNTGGRSATVLAELRHSAPVFYDAHDMGVYHQSALALLQPDGAAQLVAPLLAHNTHRFVQKGLLTDAREVCAEVELPANSTCYLVPYTKKKNCIGKYQLSVYPQEYPVTLTTLRPIAETHNCMSKDVVVQPGSGTTARVDITVSEPCDIHVLLHQNKVTDPASAKRGDHLAEDEIFMAAYEDNAVLVSSSGDASNAREHAIAFQAAKAGRYTFLVGCPSRPVTGSAPCTLSIYTPKYIQASFLAVRGTARPSIPGRLNSTDSVASTPTNGRHTTRQPQRPSSASNGAGNGSRNPRSRGYSQ